ncbi:MAG TPA: DUF1570 domain-containing protein [Pirellulales bacterium]|nr:DUF1570 domain-containing protein [Pirellulales bacterium]
MSGAQLSRWSAAATVLLAMAVHGCIGIVESPSALPARNAVVFDQLVIHSDFHLPHNHRLLNDMRAQRSDLLARLDLPPSDEPIHVYLFETESRFNNFLEEYHPEFPARRAFFVESDTRLAVYAQWGERVAEDLRHEVAHGYLHSVVRNIPLWLDEGLAEYFEVPRGNAGVNRPHVQLLVDRISKQDWRPNLPRLEALASAGEMTQDDYAESWAWAHWLLESDPARRELLRQYLLALRQHGTAEPLSQGIRRMCPAPDKALVDHLAALAQRL